MTTMTREQLLQATRARKQAQQQEGAASDLWHDLRPRIMACEVLPIISNSVLDSLVFPLNLADASGVVQHPDEMLAEMWAESLDYPFADRTSLARASRSTPPTPALTSARPKATTCAS